MWQLFKIDKKNILHFQCLAKNAAIYTFLSGKIEKIENLTGEKVWTNSTSVCCQHLATSMLHRRFSNSALGLGASPVMDSLSKSVGILTWNMKWDVKNFRTNCLKSSFPLAGSAGKVIKAAQVCLFWPVLRNSPHPPALRCYGWLDSTSYLTNSNISH